MRTGHDGVPKMEETTLLLTLTPLTQPYRIPPNIPLVNPISNSEHR